MTLLRLVLVSRSADGHGPERDAGRSEPHLQHGQHQQTAHDLPATAHPRSGILPAAPEQVRSSSGLALLNPYYFSSLLAKLRFSRVEVLLSVREEI